MINVGEVKLTHGVRKVVPEWESRTDDRQKTRCLPISTCASHRMDGWLKSRE